MKERKKESRLRRRFPASGPRRERFCKRADPAPAATSGGAAVPSGFPSPRIPAGSAAPAASTAAPSLSGAAIRFINRPSLNPIGAVGWAL
jgi:hypothetical protein